MLTDEICRFIESTAHAFVASADAAGTPHLAVGEQLHVTGNSHLVFEAWFCHTTMDNVSMNPRVAVAVTAPTTDTGYQICGIVESTADAAIMDGYMGKEEAGGPQVRYRLVIRVESVMQFSSGIHSDQPLERKSQAWE